MGIPNKLEEAIAILLEGNREVGKVFTNAESELLIEVDGEPIRLDEVYRQVGFPPFPAPNPTVWQCYQEAQGRLAQNREHLAIVVSGKATTFENGREVPQHESIAEAERHIQANLDEIEMWEKEIYGKKRAEP